MSGAPSYGEDTNHTAFGEGAQGGEDHAQARPACYTNNPQNESLDVARTVPSSTVNQLWDLGRAMLQAL